MAADEFAGLVRWPDQKAKPPSPGELGGLKDGYRIGLRMLPMPEPVHRKVIFDVVNGFGGGKKTADDHSDEGLNDFHGVVNV